MKRSTRSTKKKTSTRRSESPDYRAPLYKSGKMSREENKKISWTVEEDELLIARVVQYGTHTWRLVAEPFPNKSGKQARERWTNHLDFNLSRTPWLYHEEWILFLGVKAFGKKWAQISRMLPGRSDNCGKNHWNSRLRKNNCHFISVLRSLIREGENEHLKNRQNTPEHYIEKEKEILSIAIEKQKQVSILEQIDIIGLQQQVKVQNDELLQFDVHSVSKKQSQVVHWSHMWGYNPEQMYHQQHFNQLSILNHSQFSTIKTQNIGQNPIIVLPSNNVKIQGFSEKVEQIVDQFQQLHFPQFSLLNNPFINYNFVFNQQNQLGYDHRTISIIPFANQSGFVLKTPQIHYSQHPLIQSEQLLELLNDTQQ